MIALPSEIPVTTPLPLTVAMAVLLLLQLPNGTPLLVKVVADPTQTDELPLKTPGLTAALTVRFFDEIAG